MESLGFRTRKDAVKWYERADEKVMNEAFGILLPYNCVRVGPGAYIPEKRLDAILGDAGHGAYYLIANSYGCGDECIAPRWLNTSEKQTEYLWRCDYEDDFPEWDVDDDVVYSTTGEEAIYTAEELDEILAKYPDCYDREDLFANFLKDGE